MLMLLVGCSGRTDVIPTEPLDASYPAPVVVEPGKGYPIPSMGSSEGEENNQNLSFIENTPTPGNGTVTGTLLLNGIPVKKSNLFLAGFVQDSSGNDAVAFVSPGKSPETTTDDHGKFFFYDVPAGNYGVVFEHISDTYILLTPDGSTTLSLVVVDQETTDLGILNYDDLPIK